MKNKLLKRVISCLTATALTASMLSYSAVAEEVTTETESYPYTLFAASTNDGAITVNAGNFCINGNVATNGTIVSSGNMNINGTKTENAGEDMLYIFDKIDSTYFSSDSDSTTYDEDYTYSETNITIDIPTEVEGKTTLTGNININTALKSLENINLYGEVKNTNDSVIFSKYGDVVIDSTNVNLNGLVYAPFGDVTVTAQNLNLNNVVIIADTITFNCPNVNANFSDTAASFVGTTSENFYAPYDEWVYLDDTDSDGLPDLIEKELGSDPENSDTDGDSLPDGYEAMTLATDPSSTDTDENGVSDADEDFDEDGLTNLQEYQQNTEPYNDDTDGDGLLDGEEINTYFTDPLKADTDEDGLEDGDEIYFECDPNNTDTDGNGILDGDEKRFQTFIHEVKNEDCAVTEVRVSAEATGNMQKTTTVESIMDKDVLCTDVVGLVGEPFEVETTSEFDTATLTFVVDQSKLGDTEFDNLLFLWYNEDEDEFVELETVLDEENSTVSVETTHFSKYMIVDKVQWFEAWSTNLYEEVDSHDTTGFDTILFIDCSGSMSSNDPNAEGRKEAAEKFIKLIRTKDRIAILAEDSTPKVLCGFTSSTDKDILMDALNNIYSTGGNNFNASIKKSVEMFESESTTTHKNIIFMSDGGCDISDSTLQSAKDLNITIYTVGFGKSSWDNVLEHMAEYTGGEFYKAKTADELVDIYEKIGTEQYLDLTDTDGDGLADIFEQSGMRTTDGKLIRSDYDNKDTDGDGLEDGEEINPVYKLKEIPYSVTGTTEIVGIEFIMYADPTKEDSDGDGLLDGKAIYVGLKKVAPTDPQPLFPDIPKGIIERHIIEASDESSIPNTLGEWADLSIDIFDLMENGEHSDIALSLSNLLQFRYDENQTCLHSQTKDDIEDMLNRNDLRTMIYTYVISYLTDKVLAEAIFDDDRDYSKETWQKTSGYNLVYDAVFHVATNGNMKNDPITFEAEENDENGNAVKNEYVLWLWHGDYLNLGSGCEIGLYTNPHALKGMKNSNGKALIEQWDAVDFELPMTLYLYNKCGENIDRISKWEPKTPQWWITSFNPDYEANADEQIMIGTVDFTGKEDLYEGLRQAYNCDERKKDDAHLIFEDNTVWIFWCAEDLI